MEKHIILEQKFNIKENIGNKLDDFEILQTLGKGSYGFVSKVKSKINQKIYAMKMIDFSLIRDEKEKQLSIAEMDIISKLDSPHIIKFYGNFFEEERCYILMEFINNGDIKGYISAYQNMKKHIPEEELWELFFQCVSGLVYIHNRNIIHRDIKPANLFLTDNKSIKIGDFGVSAKRKEKTPDTPYSSNIGITQGFSKETLLIGTPLYMSPEMYNHQEYGSKVDVYALGCTFYEMCYFTPPRIPIPVMNKLGEIITDLQEVKPKQNINVYSQELINLIKIMIEKEEEKRPSSKEVLEEIKKHYNILNSSIACVFRCLLTYQNVIQFLQKQITNNDLNKIKKEKPITYSFLNAFINVKSNNFYITLNKIRDTLVSYNPLFEERDEIEPKDLIDFLIKKFHIENNNYPCLYSRIFTEEDDHDFFDENKILQKYTYTFGTFFKSRISSQFYGTKESIKTCLNCKKPRYYVESFYYLKFDGNEVNKYFSKSDNFILDVFNKESENYVQKELLCPFCKVKTAHQIKKKILTISANLIISLESEGKNLNTQNLKYPLTLKLDKYGSGTHNLKGVIKKTIMDGKKYFICIYKEKDQWLLSDGITIDKFKSSSPTEHNIGNIVMLFYSNDMY